MEINDGNLHVLAGYLQKTLSPDPVERRGGLLLLLLLSLLVWVWVKCGCADGMSVIL